LSFILLSPYADFAIMLMMMLPPLAMPAPLMPPLFRF